MDTLAPGQILKVQQVSACGGNTTLGRVLRCYLAGGEEIGDRCGNDGAIRVAVNKGKQHLGSLVKRKVDTVPFAASMKPSHP